MTPRIAQLQSPAASSPEVMKRVEIARQEFGALPRELQGSLITLASRHNIVLRRLATGQWESLMRALAGLHRGDPEGGYGTIMVALDRNIINGLAS